MTRTASAPPVVSAGQRTAGVVVAVIAGAALAVQSRINGELAVRLDDPIGAALISFGSGLVVLALLVPALPAGRAGLAGLRAALREHRLSAWQLLGGMCGGFLVATQGLTVPTLGVAVFIVALVAGQSSSSLLVDRAGVGPAGQQPVTAPRLAGAVLTVVAVLISVGDRIGHPSALALAILPLLAGLGIAWQQAVNGHVRQASGSALVAGLVNFCTGTAVLLVAFAVSVLIRGLPGHLPHGPWWLYCGGLIGILFVAAGAAVVRYTGVLLLGLGMIAGQITGALLLDVVAPGDAGRPGWNTIVGAVLTLVAVVVAVVKKDAGPARGEQRAGRATPG
ncbi:DMT family transporter [Actinoplanes sp. TFC3]|uniref:DMT family transporter n=1 Tax=Actinoplanes sp. TFC3 TaxID=1710355 RepID=UPI00082D13E7|nr:DMT family transporter [Actinoplanes sp. TFC3]